jgi:hypothetical protein
METKPEESITLNQLIKRLYIFRAEHAQSGSMKITCNNINLLGMVEEDKSNNKLELK